MTEVKLYNPRSHATRTGKFRLTPYQYHRLGVLLSRYSALIGREVSQSVVFARATDLLTDHLEALLSAHSMEAVRDTELAALHRAMG
ncbi:hypothetical protein [Magnetospirillum fulvum]|uniref:Uncharacterized protein n=1 Tax=Magnetospirillum fulvum TaxID=1082 RepID=A0A1H6IZ27_MAGFU|nr:hypothetical protein [Magnetospirillum fulvum]SEH52373.1 hypothetical protein SAMN04244559_02787 [Magnetospirillum fulvum]